MKTYARYVVIFERQLDGEDYISEHGRPADTDIEGRKQLAREIQSGFDAGYMDGTFLVISREELDQRMITL